MGHERSIYAILSGKNWMTRYENGFRRVELNTCICILSEMMYTVVLKRSALDHCIVTTSHLILSSHYSKHPYPLRNRKIANEPTGGAQEPWGHRPSWELCNFSLVMGSCFYPMTHRNEGHRVLGNCRFPNTPWDKNLFYPRSLSRIQQTALSGECHSEYKWFDMQIWPNIQFHITHQ